MEDADVSILGVNGVINDAPAEKYYRVKYSLGRIEHGSSGSPLFSSPGVVVGSSSYPPIFSAGTVCAIKPQYTGYSRFSVTYAAVKDFLENVPSDLVLPAKSALSFMVNNHVASAAQVVALTTQTNGTVSYKLRADASWIQL